MSRYTLYILHILRSSVGNVTDGIDETVTGPGLNVLTTTANMKNMLIVTLHIILGCYGWREFMVSVNYQTQNRWSTIVSFVQLLRNHDNGSDLYSYWVGEVTDQLNVALDKSPGPAMLINLASNEYFAAVQPDRLEGRIIAPRFLDAKGDGDFKVVSFFAKQARGSMAGWIVRERIVTVNAIADFDIGGYSFDAVRSTSDVPVFTRRWTGSG